jgi:hypothetical protein
VVVHIRNLVTPDVEIEGLQVGGHLGLHRELEDSLNNLKKGWESVSLIEHLRRLHEALGSIPTTKDKKRTFLGSRESAGSYCYCCFFLILIKLKYNSIQFSI